MNKLIVTAIIMAAMYVAPAYAQDIEKIRVSLAAAREAYDGGNYHKAIEKVKQVEQLIGSTTKPATAYIKIMSYYKLEEYENCMDAAEAYLNDKPAQDETLEEIRSVKQKAIDKELIKPEFKGGMPALRQFLSDNLVYPEKAQKNGIQGRTIVSFIVEKDGSVSDIQVIKGFDPDCDQAAVDAAKATSGQWKAGTLKGEKVRVSFNLPVDFKL
jgi:TonB family C-terminal domain